MNIFCRKAQGPQQSTNVEACASHNTTCATQTELKRVSVGTQTDCSSTDYLNDAICSTQPIVSASTESTVIFDGIIQSSLELLDDITDTTKQFSKITKDTEYLFAAMPVGTSTYFIKYIEQNIEEACTHAWIVYAHL